LQYRATKEGMKPGYWKVINSQGETVRVIQSAGVAREVAAKLNEEAKEYGQARFLAG
jgi:hypothetical protein